MTSARQILAGSRVVHHARRLSAGSALLGIISTVCRPTRDPGLRWTAQQEAQSVVRLRQVVGDSAIVTTLSRTARATAVAWQEARVTAWVRQAWLVDVASMVRMGGAALMAAVVTHVLWLAAFGIAVSPVGWMLRAALVAGGAAAAWRPDVVAAAVTDKAGRAD